MWIIFKAVRSWQVWVGRIVARVQGNGTYPTCSPWIDQFHTVGKDSNRGWEERRQGAADSDKEKVRWELRMGIRWGDMKEKRRGGCEWDVTIEGKQRRQEDMEHFRVERVRRRCVARQQRGIEWEGGQVNSQPIMHFCLSTLLHTCLQPTAVW